MPTPCDVAELTIPDESELNALMTGLPGIAVLRFTDGEYLIRQGEATVDTYIVISGGYVVEQALSATGDGERSTRTIAAVVADPDTPTFVGEMAYLGGGFRTASVRSAGNSVALKLGKTHLAAIINDYPYFTSILCRQLTRRLQEANQALEVLSMDATLHMKPAGEILVKAEYPAETLYQLVDGVLMREGDQEAIGPDDLDMGFLDPGPFFLDGVYAKTVKTADTCMVVAITKASKQAVIRNYPDLLLGLYKKSAGFCS